MKIDQNAALSKPLGDASSAISARDSVHAQPSVSRMPAVEQGPPASAAAVLPSTTGDFDTARVSKIRDDISAGRYKINTAKIADGLLATVRDLIGR